MRARPCESSLPHWRSRATSSKQLNATAESVAPSRCLALDIKGGEQRSMAARLTSGIEAARYPDNILLCLACGALCRSTLGSAVDKFPVDITSVLHVGRCRWCHTNVYDARDRRRYDDERDGDERLSEELRPSLHENNGFRACRCFQPVQRDTPTNNKASVDDAEPFFSWRRSAHVQ